MYYVFEFMNNWQKRLKIKAYFYTNRLCKQAIIAIQGLKKKKMIKNLQEMKQNPFCYWPSKRILSLATIIKTKSKN